ncbi:MAG: hypothetical protein R2705_10700 [Ilumatobacteraceae bacterium]
MSTIVDIDPPPDRRRTVGQTARLAVPIVYLVALYLVSPRFALSALQLTLAQLVGLAALVLWMLDRLSNHNARIHSRVTRALGVVVVTMAASYAIGLSRPLLAPQIEAADRSLVRLLSLAGAALLIAGVIRRRSDLDHFLVLLSAGALVLASAAALQALAGVDIAPWFRPPGFLDRGIKQTGLVERFGLTRASGLATHPIELGTTLAALLPITLHVAAFGRTQRHRGLASAATAMVLLALLLSISRSAFVGLFIALVAVVPFMESTRRFRLMIMAVVAIGSAFMIVPERAQAGFQLVADWRGESTDGGSNLEARTEDYTRVREAVLLHPLERERASGPTSRPSVRSESPTTSTSTIWSRPASSASRHGSRSCSPRSRPCDARPAADHGSMRAMTSPRPRGLRPRRHGVVGGCSTPSHFELSVSTFFVVFGLAAGLERVMSVKPDVRRANETTPVVRPAAPRGDQMSMPDSPAHEGAGPSPSVEPGAPIGKAVVSGSLGGATSQVITQIPYVSRSGRVGQAPRAGSSESSPSVPSSSPSWTSSKRGSSVPPRRSSRPRRSMTICSRRSSSPT